MERADVQQALDNERRFTDADVLASGLAVG
jgi:hypothetical protein